MPQPRLQAARNLSFLPAFARFITFLSFLRSPERLLLEGGWPADLSRLPEAELVTGT